MIFHVFLEINVGFAADFTRQWRAAFSMFIIPMSLTTSHAPTFELTTWETTFELKIGMFVVFMAISYCFGICCLLGPRFPPFRDPGSRLFGCLMLFKDD